MLCVKLWLVELQAFNKPDVQAAIMEITANPMAMLKHQQNPEVMQVCAVQKSA